jgi:hypothetical protein
MSDQTTELQTEITIQDLKVIAGVFELAASKGLFKASDLTLVGKIFDKIKESIAATVE